MDDQDNIRNFAIVAHIDHGKSTLADRLLEVTGTIEMRNMMDQVLDSNPIERERGITIKLAPVRMNYVFKGKKYIFNLIDTPGHVDFSYEVSRSLASCEGILLVVDATQGIQAQTMAHMQLIRARNLKVIPVLNKIDLPTAKIAEVKKSMRETFGFEEAEIIEISAKAGINIDLVLEAIITRIPSPAGDKNKPFKALVFSSKYDSHKGVVVFIRVFDGNVSQKSALRFIASGAVFNPIEIGFFTPAMKTTEIIQTGEVGYIATGFKDLTLARVGDTVTGSDSLAEPYPGYLEPKPMVYLSVYPTDTNDFLILREALEKLHLSDSSFTYQIRSSPALGKGYLCGFLGLLHAEVIRERLHNEFDLEVIATVPTVEYRISLQNGRNITIHSPEDFPDPSQITDIKEPVMYTTIYTVKETVGAVMQLCQDKRGEFVNLEYLGTQAKFTYLIPLSEMIMDFFDKLKSITSGYASLEYEFFENRTVEAVKIDIYMNKKIVDAFSQIIVKSHAHEVGDNLVNKLKSLMPRQQYQIPIQAAIGGNIIARADIKAFRKDVTQKLYGGDRTRKDKLLEAQKKGKKKLRSIGNISIPQEVFLKVFQE